MFEEESENKKISANTRLFVIFFFLFPFAHFSSLSSFFVKQELCSGIFLLLLAMTSRADRFGGGQTLLFDLLDFLHSPPSLALRFQSASFELRLMGRDFCPLTLKFAAAVG